MADRDERIDEGLVLGGEPVVERAQVIAHLLHRPGADDR
jgi:hypothetical protein